MALPSSSGGSISIGQIWAETGAPANPNEDINTVKNSLWNGSLLVVGLVDIDNFNGTAKCRVAINSSHPYRYTADVILYAAVATYAFNGIYWEYVTLPGNRTIAQGSDTSTLFNVSYTYYGAGAYLSSLEITSVSPDQTGDYVNSTSFDQYQAKTRYNAHALL
jgi:hypothetical protein